MREKEVAIRVTYLPVNQAWCVTFGRGDAEDSILAGPYTDKEDALAFVRDTMRTREGYSADVLELLHVNGACDEHGSAVIYTLGVVALVVLPVAVFVTRVFAELAGVLS